MNTENKSAWDYSELLEEAKDRIEEQIALEGKKEDF